NAVIHTSYEKALDEAAALEADPTDRADAPFRGLPMLLKDLWPHSAGDPFHQGNKGLKNAGYVHPVDSDLVRRYREAGFVILGRTNTPEFGLSATTEPEAYGPTHNPWSLDHGAGGSSGGAAAAVAAGMVPAANASDGGGSIRIPAAMCGLVGLKPSRGRLPMGPSQDEWGNSVQHVVSHTVRDTAQILDATAHPTLGDGVVAPRHGQPYAVSSQQDPGRLRIGFLTESGRPGVDVDAEVAAATRAAAALLGSLGHDLSESHPEAIDQQIYRERMRPAMAAGAGVAVAHLADLLGREVTADDVEIGTWTMAQAAGQIPAIAALRAQGAAMEFRRHMAQWWEDGFDLLLTPTCAQPAPVLGAMSPTPEEPMRMSTGSIPFAVFTSMFNTTGQPGISLPLARTDSGLPIGMQLVAAYGREDLLLQVANQLEGEVRWAENRAPIHP
ncbi:MAG: amidase, partial [Acidimicrobiales bacterium]|nr:amidase [Acidimicrobiales bacterium]